VFIARDEAHPIRHSRHRPWRHAIIGDGVSAVLADHIELVLIEASSMIDFYGREIEWGNC